MDPTQLRFIDAGILFFAHIDSKTELMDHRRRYFFSSKIPVGIMLTIILGIISGGDYPLHLNGIPFADIIYWVSVILTLPMLFLACGLGLNLLLGRFLEPSQGAVDDGASCAALLGLADALSAERNLASSTKITIVLFTGEEVNMQGSRAYVRSREWSHPVGVVNLELMGQNGRYVYWEKDGDAFRLKPTDSRLVTIFQKAVAESTGEAPYPVGPVNSDGSSFLFAGIPTIVIGSLDKIYKADGLHRPSDNLSRVQIDRLPQVVDLLKMFIKMFDEQDRTQIEDQ